MVNVPFEHKFWILVNRFFSLVNTGSTGSRQVRCLKSNPSPKQVQLHDLTKLRKFTGLEGLRIGGSSGNLPTGIPYRHPTLKKLSATLRFHEALQPISIQHINNYYVGSNHKVIINMLNGDLLQCFKKPPTSPSPSLIVLALVQFFKWTKR